MKNLLIIFCLFVVKSFSKSLLSPGDLMIPCSKEFNACNSTLACQVDLLKAVTCIAGTSYGCPQANINLVNKTFNESNPAYVLSCLYNCFENVKPLSSQFSTLRNCVNQNINKYDRICPSQTINCLQDSTLGCVGNLNQAL